MKAAETSENCTVVEPTRKSFSRAERLTHLLEGLVRTERVGKNRTVGTRVNTEVLYFFPNQSVYVTSLTEDRTRNEAGYASSEKRVVSCAACTVL